MVASPIPEVEIHDWPALAYRGFMMDTSHGPLPTEDEIKRRILEASNDCLDAFHAHHPQAFSGRIILLKATDLDDWMEITDPSGACGWGAICKDGVAVIPIACRHLDLFKEPNTTALARHINAMLR